MALVTGGRTGIGLAIVFRLDKQGYNMVVNDIDPVPGQKTSNETGNFAVRLVAIPGDAGGEKGSAADGRKCIE